MSRALSLVLLASCIPLKTSMSTSSSTSGGSPPGTGQNDPGGDERRARHESEVPIKIEPPRPLDPTPRPCIAAQNHCMRDGWFFATSSASGAPFPIIAGRPVDQNHAVDYSGAKIDLDGHGGFAHGVRTVAATKQNIPEGRPIVVFCPKGAWPRSEAEMLTSKEWMFGVAKRVDLEAGTVDVVGENGQASPHCPNWVTLDNVRVVVDYRIGS
ncbi:MAG TPA: hypothetical protein VK427_12985 [Kofleriaceae bacterium]|nr:hypothetical protein [Kofleriaceae bacterium]